MHTRRRRRRSPGRGCIRRTGASVSCCMSCRRQGAESEGSALCDETARLLRENGALARGACRAMQNPSLAHGPSSCGFMQAQPGNMQRATCRMTICKRAALHRAALHPCTMQRTACHMHHCNAHRTTLRWLAAERLALQAKLDSAVPCTAHSLTAAPQSAPSSAAAQTVVPIDRAHGCPSPRRAASPRRF